MTCPAKPGAVVFTSLGTEPRRLEALQERSPVIWRQPALICERETKKALWVPSSSQTTSHTALPLASCPLLTLFHTTAAPRNLRAHGKQHLLSRGELWNPPCQSHPAHGKSRRDPAHFTHTCQQSSLGPPPAAAAQARRDTGISPLF